MKSHKGSSFDQSFHIYDFCEATRRAAIKICIMHSFEPFIHISLLFCVVLCCCSRCDSFVTLEWKMYWGNSIFGAWSGPIVSISNSFCFQSRMEEFALCSLYIVNENFLQIQLKFQLPSTYRHRKTCMAHLYLQPLWARRCGAMDNWYTS